MERVRHRGALSEEMRLNIFIEAEGLPRENKINHIWFTITRSSVYMHARGEISHRLGPNAQTTGPWGAFTSCPFSNVKVAFSYSLFPAFQGASPVPPPPPYMQWINKRS